MATKREKLVGIINYIEGKETEIFPVEMVEYCSHEIELLDKKASTPRKPTAKQVENEDLKNTIFEFLTESGSPQTVKTIMAGVDFTGETLSNQRTTHILTALRKEGKVKRTVVKRVPYYEIGYEEMEDSEES